MSDEQEQIRSLAERIARSVGSSERRAAGTVSESASATSGDLAALREGLAEIKRRLAHIESHIGHDESCSQGREDNASSTRSERAAGTTRETQSANDAQATPTRSPWLSGTYVPAAVEHPSQERFGIDEAVSEIVDYFEREKTCSVEPGGKPCDHCGMCSSRGF